MDAGRDRCMNIDMDMVAAEIYADGSDTPKKVVQRGLIPCKNCSEGCCACRKNFVRGV
jgi:hypothetical protein